MLEQLIESKGNTKENKTRGGFFLTTFILAACLCFSAILSSLFAMNLTVGDEDLEFSSLVTPVIPVETKPAKPESPQKQQNQSQNPVIETTRQANILRISENPIVPDKTSVVPNTQKTRPPGPFKIGPGLEKDSPVAQNNFTRGTDVNGGSIGPNIKSTLLESSEKEEERPAIQKKPVVAEKAAKPARITGGVVNGKATSLPVPLYPPAARSIKASGEVTVQVLIDKSGRVVSANAVSGHSLLRAEAEKAARNAKFKPTLLTGEPVEVTGVIVYKFSL